MLALGLFSEPGENRVYLELGQLRRIEKGALQGVVWSLIPVREALSFCDIANQGQKVTESIP